MANLFQTLGRSVDGIDTPRQLALGLAIGCMAGLLPKDNLMFAGLLVFIVASGANLLTGAVSTLTASFLAGPTQPIAHSLGQQFLSIDFVITPLTKFLQLPIAPWTRLDNTVVSGSLLIGLIAFLPIYIASLFVFNRYRQTFQRIFVESNVATWIVGYPTHEEE